MKKALERDTKSATPSPGPDKGKRVRVRLAFGMDFPCTRLASTHEVEECQSAVRCCLHLKGGSRGGSTMTDTLPPHEEHERRFLVDDLTIIEGAIYQDIKQGCLAQPMREITTSVDGARAHYSVSKTSSSG